MPNSGKLQHTQNEESSSHFMPVLGQQHKGILAGSLTLLCIPVKVTLQEVCLLELPCRSEQALHPIASRCCDEKHICAALLTGPMAATC